MTGEELRDFAADHLYYELLMFHETAMGLKTRENLSSDFALKNAFLESFTIHVRVLALFLYYAPRYEDDVSAEHYVKDITAWKADRGPMSPELQEVVDRTGKEIAHLTRGRRSPGDPMKAWTIEHVYRLLCGPLHRFLKHADPARLDASVPAFIANLPKPPSARPQPTLYGPTPLPLDDESGPSTNVSTP